MAYVFLSDGDYQRAGKLFRICLRQFQKDGSTIGVVYTIEGLAGLYTNEGQAEFAVRLFACADTMRKKLGNSRPLIEQGNVDKGIAACLALIGETAFSDAYDDGQRMTLDEAIAFALRKD